MSLQDDSVTFKSLGLSDDVVGVLEELGYEAPTPIQTRAIPPLIEGRDVLGSAATGTGKTAAFALPLVERLDGKRQAVQALIMTPTRELAIQVAEAVHRYGSRRRVSVVPIYGGQPIQRQLLALKRGVQVVVGTPGRLLDHIRRGSLDLSGVRYVVLDEADEMLDMGFIEDIEAILTETPPERQTALFSATFPPRINDLVRRHLREPERITIKAEVRKTPRVRQVAYVAPRPQKLAVLKRILDMESPSAAIIFCRTRTEVDELTESLASHGYSPEALHGGFAQAQRDRVMARFREGTADLLIATDVAARGIDVEHVTHVINYDIPESPDVYVHRIGRTGRAGREGVAITLVQPREHWLLKAIEKVVKQRIEPGRIPSVADIKARRIAALTEALREALSDQTFDGYRVAVQTLADEHDALDIAAAAMKLAAEAVHGDEPESTGESAEEFGAERSFRQADPTRERRDKREKPSRSGRSAPAGDGTRPPKRRPEATVQLTITLGDARGVRPKDIVGAIANEAGVPGHSIGAIEISEKHSTVEVPESAAEKVIRALSRSSIKGQRVQVKRSRE